MIDRVEDIRFAVCDVCGASLIDGSSVNYAELSPHFGYGSVLDSLTTFNPRYDLCHKCYQSVIEHIDTIKVKR